MTKELTRAIHHALIDRGETMTDLANALGRTRQWVYWVLKEEQPDGIARINEYLGLEGENNEESTD